MNIFFEFIKSIIIYVSGYYLVDYGLTEYSPKYNELEKDRKNYVLKNIVKSVVLAGLVVYATPKMYWWHINNSWENDAIYRLGIYYCATDLVGLIMVRQLPVSTKIHHVCSVTLGVINTYIDYTQPTFWFGLVMYAFFSVWTFMVNFYLGIRVIYKNWFVDGCCVFALVTYVLICCANWLYQYQIIINELYGGIMPDIGFVVFVSMIHFIIYDDIKLISFLKYNSKKILGYNN